MVFAQTHPPNVGPHLWACLNITVPGKTYNDTNFESSGNVDDLLFSVAAAPLNL